MLVCWFVVLLIWSGYRVWRSIAEGDTVYTSVVSKVVTPSYSFTQGPVISRPQDSQEPSSRKQEEGDRDRGQGESPDCCHHCHGVIPVMILLLISADNWGLHGDGENGEDDLSHTISLQLDIYWILHTFYISTPAAAEYYALVTVAGCNWGWSIIASCNWTQQETRSDWFSTELPRRFLWYNSFVSRLEHKIDSVVHTVKVSLYVSSHINCHFEEGKVVLLLFTTFMERKR